MARKFNVRAATQAAIEANRAQASAPEQVEPAPPADAAPQPEPQAPAGRGQRARAAPPKQDQPAPAPELTVVPDSPADVVLASAPEKLDKRVHVPMTERHYRLLKKRGADDDIDTTVRIRAMIELYETDERHRARVDKLAKQRNADLIRHRWSNP